MRSLTFATLCMAGLSQARLGHLQARMDNEECCPCPGPDGATTVTVTEKAAPAETVYISERPKEVVAKPAVTVFMTSESSHPKPVESSTDDPTDNGADADGENDDNTVNDGPGDSGSGNNQAGDNSTKDTTKDDGSDGQEDPASNGGNDGDKEQGSEQAVTEVIKPSSGPSTVTVSSESAGDRTVTVKPSQEAPSQEAPSDPKVVTVTEAPKKPSSVAVPEKPKETDEKVVTQTLEKEHPKQQKGPETVVVSAVPSIVTVTQDGKVTTKVVEKPSSITVTAAPEVETVSVKDLETVTQTVTDSHGDINIEINIININTGETTCHVKDTDKPCGKDSNTPQKQSTSCPPLEPSTSIATVLNTVTVAVDQHGMARNGTASMGVAKPTGAAALMGRVPYAPRSQRLW